MRTLTKEILKAIILFVVVILVFVYGFSLN
jgi:hypothetical protein